MAGWGARIFAKLTDVIERRLIIPLGLFQALTGIGLIWTVGFDLTATHWLAAGIILYVVAITFAIFIQARTVEAMIHVVEAMPAPTPGPHPVHRRPSSSRSASGLRTAAYF